METGILTAGKKNNVSKVKEDRFFDYTLLFIIVFMVLFGLVMVYSVSSYKGFTDYNDSLYFVKRQTFYAFAGLVAMAAVAFFVAKVDLIINILNSKVAYAFYIAAVVMQGLVLFGGSSANGSIRWLSIGGLTLQPSEISKILMILFTSYVVSNMGRQLNKWYKILWLFVLCLPVIYMVARENLTTGIIIAAIVFAIVFVAGRKFITYVPIIMLGVAGVAFMIVGTGYRSERVDAWMQVATHEKAYQIRQALYAIGSGGAFGKGLGNGIQKEFIPEAHTDMIFSCITEELGIIGAIGIIILFALLLWRCIVIANNAPDLYSQLVVVGVMTHISVQAIINIAVATNTMPNTGVTLPFISYGGTSIFFLLVEVGLVLGISRRIRLTQSDEKGVGQ